MTEMSDEMRIMAERVLAARGFTDTAGEWSSLDQEKKFRDDLCIRVCDTISDSGPVILVQIMTDRYDETVYLLDVTNEATLCLLLDKTIEFCEVLASLRANSL